MRIACTACLVVGLSSVRAGEFEINEGLSGAWFDPATAGQGMLFDVVPAIDLFFMAWFTFDVGDDSKLGVPEMRWLTAQGSLQDRQAELTLSSSSGGVFANPTEVTTVPVGSATIEFFSCTEARLTYELTEDQLSGTIDLVRLSPDVFCEDLAFGR